MNNATITQENVHLLLPSKVAQLADRLIKSNLAANIPTALNLVYSSSAYTKLEQEKTKYWWLGVNTLLHDLLEGNSEGKPLK